MEFSKTKIKSIVKKTLVEYLGPHPLIDDGSMESLFLDNPPFIIAEGLIKTYPIDKFIEPLSRVFNLFFIKTDYFTQNITNKVVEILGDEDNNGCIVLTKGKNKTDVLYFYVGNGESNKILLDRYLNKYGYFLSKTIKINSEWVRYQYEKKFDNDATEIVRSIGYLYHISKQSIKNKILKQGLTPRESQWNGFDNQSRCYFFLPIDKTQIDKWVMNFRLAKKQYEEKYMLLRIDTNKLPEDIKFYFDPRMENGVYTIQGIPPTAISIVEENIIGKF